MKRIKSSCENMLNTMEIVEKNGSNGIEDMHRNFQSLKVKTEECYRRVVELVEITDIVENYTYMPIKYDMKIEKENELYHFILPEHLPHALRVDFSSRQLKYNYDSSMYYSMYRSSMEEYLENNIIEMSKTKMLLYVITHYGNKNLIDNDNLNVKTFVDAAIKGIFIPDDNPRYLDIYLTSSFGNEDYTEIFIGPVEDILHFINKKRP